ncbi:MAG TPA: hypothetical protein ENI27_06325 [bacterium]|nr:hypothetical protein [bacterium]
MKAVRVLFVYLMVFFPLLAYGFGIDIGGNLANASALSGSAEPVELTFLQQNKASLWLEMEFGSYLGLALQGSYLFDLERPVFFDLDYLHLYGVGQVSFNVGRLRFSDFSGMVLAHTLDGGRIKVALPILTASAAVGFSGLVQKPVSSIIMTKSDLNDQADDSMFFAPQRLIEMVDVKFPELFWRQDVTVSVLLQQDLRAQTKVVSGGGKLSSQYFGVGLAGPLVVPLYYSAYFYLGAGGYQDTLLLSILSGGKVSLYLEQVLSSRIELSGLYASGDETLDEFYEGRASGTSGLFTPISPPAFGLVFSPQVGNIWLLGLDYTIKPFSKTGSKVMKNLQTSLKGIAYFRSTAGPISEGGLATDSSDLYLGTEVDGRISFRPMSDLGAALVFGFFIPNSASVLVQRKMEFSAHKE